MMARITAAVANAADDGWVELSVPEARWLLHVLLWARDRGEHDLDHVLDQLEAQFATRH